MLRVFAFILLWMLAFFAGGTVLFALISALAAVILGRNSESAAPILKGIWTALPIVIIPGTLLLGLLGKLPGTRPRNPKPTPPIPPP